MENPLNFYGVELIIDGLLCSATRQRVRLRCTGLAQDIVFATY